MRLAEPIETTGMFWLPEEPETRLPGVLRISETSEIMVELTGVIGNPPSVFSNVGAAGTPRSGDGDSDLARIVGTVEKGGQITLDRCFRQGGKLVFPSGLFRSTFHASLAFLGVEYGKEEQVSFSEFSFSVDGLDAWLSISGIGKLEFEEGTEKTSGSIRFHTPEDISLTLSSGDQLEFSFSLSFPNVAISVAEMAVKQTSLVRVRSERPQSVEYFSTIAVRLCNFLSLALDQDVGIQSMTGYLDQETDDGKGWQHPVRAYAQFPPLIDRSPSIRRHRALFLFPAVADRIGDVVTKWFDSYDTFAPALDLYFASRTQTQAYLETKALWLAQALETLHRRSSDETEMPHEEFRERIDLVIKSCPANIQDWVREKLQYENGLSFKSRIERLVEPFASWFGSNSSESEAFIRRIRDTRNYLTHYDAETTKKRADRPDELVALYREMEALLQLHLLRLIGFDHSSIGSLVEQNARLRRKLNGGPATPEG